MNLESDDLEVESWIEEGTLYVVIRDANYDNWYEASFELDEIPDNYHFCLY